MAGCEHYQNYLAAWLDGEMSPQAQSTLDAHLAVCAGCRREFAELELLASDLEVIGERVVAADERVLDLVSPVMAAVSRGRENPRIVALDERRSAWRRVAPWVTAPLAAAATLLIIWASGYQLALQPVSTTPVAKHEPAKPASKAAPAPVSKPEPDTAAGMGAARGTEEMARVKSHLFDNVFLRDVAEGDTPESAFEDLAGLSMDELLNARRDAIVDPEARDSIAQWASLTLEKARALAGSAAPGSGAAVGAANALPPEEAQPILLAAVEANPEDPYLRYRLGSFYSKTPQTQAKASTVLQEAAALDSDNAMARYRLAASYFAQGDLENGLNTLNDAQALERADSYAADSAKYRADALQASGASSDVARALSALTAGNSEYGDLVELSNELLQYGQYYEQNGDPETAELIYSAVQQFGQQVAAGASHSTEQLAGLDIEQSAIEVLSTLVSFIQSPDNVETLTRETERLIEAFSAMGDFLNNLNELFSSSDNSIFDMAMDFILENGDLGLFDFLQGQTSTGH